jgi:hypothetical protein
MFAAITLFTVGGFAQDEPNVLDESLIPENGSAISDFVPEGWKVETSVSGDLNGDRISDEAVTLIEDKPARDKDEFPVDRGRGLVILFGQKGQGFVKAAVAGNLLQCPLCGGAFYGASDAPANVTIEKGVLVVQQDRGSRWVTDMTFRFRYDEQPSMFILIGFDYSSRDRAEGKAASESTNYLTGKRITTLMNGKTRTTVVEKKRYSIEEVDHVQFDGDATTRLGLD